MLRDMEEEMMQKECNDCEFGTEAGGCESAGAEWKTGKWRPTKECVNLKRILLESAP